MIPLTEEILQIIKNDKLDWKYISSEIILSEDFIREFNRKLNFYSISRYQVLSEDFIREFKYYLKWEYISRYQVLSEDFVEEFKNKIEGDPDIVYCDNNFAKNKLNWDIKYNIDDIIKSYILMILN